MALLVAGLVFWFGPSEPASCSDRAPWTEHYGTVDGRGGPGFQGCLAPSTANYVLSGTALVLITVAGVVIDAVRAVGRPT